jgi:polysaccharide export outer membrane protein
MTTSQRAMRRTLLLLPAVLLLCPLTGHGQHTPLALDASAPAAQKQASPSAPIYVVNPGDSLEVTFRWTPEFNQTVVVQPDGHAMLTATGDLVLAGLTLDQVHDEIVRAASATLVNPVVTVAVKDIERPHVLVAGEVVTPGKYDLRQATTVLQAIFLAGGNKDSADMSHIVLFRRVNTEYSQVYKLNFNKIDKGRRPTHDMILQPGDMLLVPRDGLTKFGRYVKSLNIGAYLNPLPVTTY